MYLDPGASGPNEFHVILPGVPSQEPRVSASHNGAPAQPLHQYTVSPGHYIDFVVISPGNWRFSVETRFGRTYVTFGTSRTVSP
jgi:hypothetical protein